MFCYLSYHQSEKSALWTQWPPPTRRLLPSFIHPRQSRTVCTHNTSVDPFNTDSLYGPCIPPKASVSSSSIITTLDTVTTSTTLLTPNPTPPRLCSETPPPHSRSNRPLPKTPRPSNDPPLYLPSHHPIPIPSPLPVPAPKHGRHLAPLPTSTSSITGIVVGCFSAVVIVSAASRLPYQRTNPHIINRGLMGGAAFSAPYLEDVRAHCSPRPQGQDRRVLPQTPGRVGRDSAAEEEEESESFKRAEEISLGLVIEEGSVQAKHSTSFPAPPVNSSTSNDAGSTARARGRLDTSACTPTPMSGQRLRAPPPNMPAKGVLRPRSEIRPLRADPEVGEFAVAPLALGKRQGDYGGLGLEGSYPPAGMV
ncbi:uncharacterized protein BDZ99DRAFT_482571 [Mytilinidion resinicola]|uniref:Uncharacterized protein n=1 Tax=Mytilinidion resinicola TaxID=574789 RepID=A0A6A6Y396_9PEZI|nr:uncharacterized protein BDZ99DRAFT_482571 [Mytilinidion resinicola]KAF2802695.1 hypothetical protein BDZ99DRAFT_482571 [Mytilinidion resinicola]